MITAYFNCIIISDGKELHHKAVLFDEKKIIAVTDADKIPPEAKKTDLQGAFLAPGLIDLQVYGSGGKLFSGNPTAEALEQMENDFLQNGTTGFFATVATNSDAIVKQAIISAKAYREKAKGNFLGIHLEGPYINPVKKGAHPEAFIKKASLTEAKQWIEMADGVVKMITIAPELQDQEVINYLNEQKIIISCGHTNATYAQGLSFLNGSIPAVTHLYNAMPSMHHREPGLIPAVFEKRPYSSIVADGIHVSFPMIALAKRELGDKLFLITDAVTEDAEGTPHHFLKGDRYTLADGTLSGSCLTMLKAVKNCVEQVGIPLPEAINMASLYPAELIKQDHQKGKIEAGHRADMIAFNKDFGIKSVTFGSKGI